MIAICFTQQSDHTLHICQNPTGAQAVAWPRPCFRVINFFPWRTPHQDNWISTTVVQGKNSSNFRYLQMFFKKKTSNVYRHITYTFCSNLYITPLRFVARIYFAPTSSGRSSAWQLVIWQLAAPSKLGIGKLRPAPRGPYVDEGFGSPSRWQIGGKKSGIRHFTRGTCKAEKISESSMTFIWWCYFNLSGATCSGFTKMTFKKWLNSLVLCLKLSLSN